MSFARGAIISDLATIPRIPRWVTAAWAETVGDVAVLSGAAVSHLHLVLSHAAVPQHLLRDRLDLRAAVHLEPPGDLPGPAGETCLAWRSAVERPVSVTVLQRALSGVDDGRIGSSRGQVRQPPGRQQRWTPF